MPDFRESRFIRFGWSNDDVIAQSAKEEVIRDGQTVVPAKIGHDIADQGGQTALVDPD